MLLPPSTASTVMATHTATARNFSVESENKIHSDVIARRFGFTGALVPGVAVFGHLSVPLSRQYGERWLTCSSVTTRFLKPAYHGDALLLTDQEDEGTTHVECANADGVLLATADCTFAPRQSAPEARAHLRGPAQPATRVDITWDTVRIDEPFPLFVWQPDAAQNHEYAARVEDDTPLFGAGVLHPHAILSQANLILVRQFIMPAWIHTGSTIRFHKLLRVGDAIEVRAVPLEKWERRGHQFLKLYVAYAVAGEITTEIEHTAIFRVAERD
jgi:acyl dehydratase